MHLLSLIAFFAILVAALAVALVKTCVDLLERGPYEAPFLSDDGLAWRSRGQAEDAELPRPADAWPADRERSAL